MDENISESLAFTIKVIVSLIAIYILITLGLNVEEYFKMLIEFLSNA